MRRAKTVLLVVAVLTAMVLVFRLLAYLDGVGPVPWPVRP